MIILFCIISKISLFCVTFAKFAKCLNVTHYFQQSYSNFHSKFLHSTHTYAYRKYMRRADRSRHSERVSPSLSIRLVRWLKSVNVITSCAICITESCTCSRDDQELKSCAVRIRHPSTLRQCLPWGGGGVHCT